MILLIDILHLVDRARIRRVFLQSTLHCVLGPFDLYFVDVVEGVFPDSERHHNLLTSSVYDFSSWVRNTVEASFSPFMFSRTLMPTNLTSSPVLRLSVFCAWVSQRLTRTLPVPSSSSIFETLVLRPSFVSISRTSPLSTILPLILHRAGPGRRDSIVAMGMSGTKSVLSFLTKAFEPTLT